VPAHTLLYGRLHSARSVSRLVARTRFREYIFSPFPCATVGARARARDHTTIRGRRRGRLEERGRKIREIEGTRARARARQANLPSVTTNPPRTRARVSLLRVPSCVCAYACARRVYVRIHAAACVHMCMRL